MVTTTLSQPVLALEHAQKSFGAVQALADGDIELFAGEVHGLVGENGAGKSTLVKILAGVHRPDAGRLVLDGAEAVFDNAKQSQAAGIAIIFQEPTLFPDLSVAENIFVGMQPLKRFRRIDGRRMRRDAAGFFEQLGVRLDPDRLARGLSIADQQLVEIAKALTANARVIVMDEPTAALTTTEVERLFGIVETLRARGNAVLFVSHRLEEISAICRRGPHGGRARDLRDRPRGRRLRRDGRPAPAPGIAGGRDGSRDRTRARRPAPAGARDGLLDRAQHRARIARPRPARRADPARR